MQIYLHLVLIIPQFRNRNSPVQNLPHLPEPVGPPSTQENGHPRLSRFPLGSITGKNRNVVVKSASFCYTVFFGEEPPKIGAVAVMTDTDDTRDEVAAWYGDIFLESAK